MYKFLLYIFYFWICISIKYCDRFTFSLKHGKSFLTKYRHCINKIPSICFNPQNQKLLNFKCNSLDSMNQNMNDGISEQKGIVTMYKKEGCPFCVKATELLESYRLQIKFVDIESENREEILSQMRSFSGGRNTVPQIFFNSEHLGGNDDIQQLEKDGKLLEKVNYVRSTTVTMMQDHWYHPWY